MSQLPAVPDLSLIAASKSCGVSCTCGVDERMNCELYRLVAAATEAPASSKAAQLFAVLPKPKTADLYGVRYAVFERPDFGQLLVTRYGWPMLDLLMPENWFVDGRFWRDGERLGQSTGTVYRYTLPGGEGGFENVVVKVSRYAQDVPFYASAAFLEKLPEQTVTGLRFNNPFEEFGRLWRLRSNRRGPRVLTKRPLAIYSPPEKLPLWKHGRIEWAAVMEQQAVAAEHLEGFAHVELDPHRSYFSIFGWVRGKDASTYHQAGQISAETMAELTEASTADLMANGMMVLDHKPAHLIIRWDQRRRDWVRRDDGRIAYALVDFELLVDLPGK